MNEESVSLDRTLWNRRLPALLVLAGLLSTPAHADSPQDYIWLESETPTGVAPANYNPTVSDAGRSGYLSRGNWLHLNVSAGDVEKSVPAGGVVLTYNFAAPKTAVYELWNCVGFERIRSPFEWRVDNGAWSTVKPTQDTIDVEELQTWNPVGWLDMGSQTLAAGGHNLQIRVSRSKDDKGNTAAFIYASDALCLTSGAFHPDGPRKPGDPAAQSRADQAAAAHVFEVTAPGAAQTAIALKGEWQIAGDDEMVVEDRLGPIRAAPSPDDLSWHAISVPGDRNKAFPEMAYVHRYFLRTRVRVPADLGGRSFYLHVPSENMIATVFVNGRQCGWTKAPFAEWQCDVTAAIKAGRINEIWIGVKDDFYALDDPGNVNHPQYLPFDFWHYNAWKGVDMPVSSHFDTGLLLTPSLVVAGKAYTSDVFAMPSVKNKTLGLEVTVHNPTDQPVTVALTNKVVPLAGGPAEKSFASQTVTVAPGQDQTVTIAERWANPKLWQPDSPTQYDIVTTLLLDGRPIDERTTKFGFREWGWNGPQFTLNGIPWHGHADLAAYGQANEAAVALWRKHGQTMQRVWGETTYDGKTMPEALDFFDSHGVPVRRTDIFDGEGADYGLVETVNGKTVPKKALFENWRAQLAAWVKGQRNHPSIFLWSLENEITFINAHVFGLDAIVDPEMTKAWDVVRAIDPTRPAMTDGGNALLDESLPVYGGHYMQPSQTSLPEGAYDRAGYTHRQVWPITGSKPILFGEDFFANGVEQADLATIGGESAFIGKAEAHPAIGLEARMLSEGYRWLGINFQFWMGGESDAYYNSWQPIAALCREWDSSFAAGQKVTRTLGIFNDTREDQSITLLSTLELGGKKVSGETSVHKVAAGTDEKFSIVLPMPAASVRQEGTWTLRLMVHGQQVFQDVRPISVLRPKLLSAGTSPGSGLRLASSSPAPESAQAVAVYDPYGSVIAFLTKEGVPFTRIAGPGAAPMAAKVLVIGKDALSSAQSASSLLAAYASAGKTVVVLEQKNPLRYQALPGAMNPDANQGNIAFIEDADNPILRGLSQKDFFTWGADGKVYQNAYQKPTAGGKSLIQCSDRLQDTALAQMNAGKGLMLISQLLIGQKLADNPIAQQLLLNMIGFGRNYKQTFRPVTAAARDNPLLARGLDATGLNYTKTGDALSAISKPGAIAIINASPVNLRELAANPARADAFTRGGGWIVFNNLTPEGLADFNKIVGVDHVIRPYKQEKVTWPAIRNPLLAGVAASNIVMGSGKQIFPWSSGQYPDTDAYSYVVDLDEVAPFGKSSFPNWDNITNNYTQNDGFWPFIINLPVPRDGKPLEIPITLARPEKLIQWTWVSDLNYQGTTRVSLIFNGTDKVSFDTVPNGDPQTFPINPPRTAQNITLEINDWQHNSKGGPDLIGIDNIYFKAARPAGFYQKVKPMLNIGAMVDYPRGVGGIVLCNVKFKETEANPENTGKKQKILATLLRNLNAPFSGGKTIIAGAANLVYTPLDISKQANAFRNEKGWFGDKSFTFANLPPGPQNFAGVRYNVYHFTTSPVPEAIILGGSGVPGNLPDHVAGIPVNQKADALFFLQAARIDVRRNAEEIKQGKRYEMADYVVHYADGTSVKVPIVAEISVDNYKQDGTASPAPEAQIAWTAPYGTSGAVAAAYAQQWNNPNPGKVIQSIDLVYGPDRRGVPALLAVTAAKAP